MESSTRAYLRRLRWDHVNQRYQKQAAPIRRRAKDGFRFVRRKVLRISKAKCARICGVSRGTVARWENPASDSLPDAGHLGQLGYELGYGSLLPEMMIIMGLAEVRGDE